MAWWAAGVIVIETIAVNERMAALFLIVGAPTSQ